MKVKFSFSLCLCLFAFFVNAQHADMCGNDKMLRDLFANDAQAAQRFMQQREAILNYLDNDVSRDESRNVIITIPVVFHIIHGGQAQGVGTNITDAQVYSQLEVLNECYRLRNADTSAIPAWFNDRKADVQIEFCLAQFDTAGNPSTGITRHNIANTNNFDTNIKPNTQWDPTKYLNIWTSNLASPLLGYATPPGLFPLNQDGVVLDYRHVGKYPVNPNQGTHDQGRTCVHEVGHWLNLFHVFQDSCVGLTPQTCKYQGDYICDTPPAKEATFGQPNLLQNTCTETPVDERDMWMNYMDYADDNQLHLFTRDQADVIRATLATSRLGILSSMGCTNENNVFAYTGKVTEAGTANGVANAKVLFDGPTDFEAVTDGSGNFTIPNLIDGLYDVYAGKWGYMTNQYSVHTTYSAGTAAITIPIENRHYYDDFLFDYSWTKSATATAGFWVRAIPVGTFYQSELSNPELDVTSDYGLKCYTTGNGGGGGSTDDIDNGSVTLISPSIDLSGFTDPYVRYLRWFTDGAQSGNTPDDNMTFKINNGSGTAVIESVTPANGPANMWTERIFRLNDFTTLSSDMRFIVEVSDLTGSNPNIVEGAFDKFEIKEGIILGLNDAVDADMAVSIYPNPGNGLLHVRYALGSGDKATLKVSNPLGEQVAYKETASAQGTISIDLGNQPAGIYFVTVQGPHSEKTLKFLLQH
ncbi:MAG TPA: M43 family zinc metalloprotease [Chitinophagales bacterium]|nr:M43 family zinc metalloprotease [Chitinophagales bacterium]